MLTQVSEISPVLVEVKVEVPWDRVQKQLDEQFSRVAKQAKVKGFRPGKVPRNVVKQLFGAQVKGEVTANLVEEGFVAAVKEHSLEVVAQPTIDAPPSWIDGSPLKFTAKVEVRPKVGTVATDALTVYREKTEIPDSDVTAEVDRLREQHATLRSPEPARPAREGDVLTIDYAVSIDGAPRPELSATGRKVELAKDALIPGFDEALTGMSVGESKDAEITLPADHQREDLRGKTAVFTLKLTELQEKLLPEADDELAKDTGNHETLLELRLALRKRLEDAANKRLESDLREQALEALVEKNPVPVPPSLVQQQQRQLLREFAQLLQMTGQKPPAIGDEFQTTLKARAERHVQAGILLGALAKQENIKVELADVDAKLQEIAERTGKHIAKVRVEMQGERRQNLESQILEDKLMAHLLGRATIVDGKRPEATSVASEPGSAAEEKSESEAEKAEGAPKKKRTKKTT